jgi:CheY-like chemotaxis protein
MTFQKTTDDKHNPVSISNTFPYLLYAEDDPIVQHVMLHLFDKLGCIVDLAVNGQEALDKYLFSRQHYDAIVLDGGLPKLSGFEIARHIRLHEQILKNNYQESIRIPLILFSAYPYEEVSAECILADIDQFAIKPVPVDEIYAILTCCLTSTGKSIKKIMMNNENE